MTILLPKSLCGVWWVVVCKPILVFSLSQGQAEQKNTYWMELFIGVMQMNLNCWGKKTSSETRQQGTDPLQTGLNHSFDKYGNLRHKSIAYTLFNIYLSFEEKRHGRISSSRMRFWGNGIIVMWFNLSRLCKTGNWIIVMLPDNLLSLSVFHWPWMK